jgi:hypothetical protein
MSNPESNTHRTFKELGITEDPQLVFIHWLNTALQDERWRAFIGTQLRRTELPVIEITR